MGLEGDQQKQAFRDVGVGGAARSQLELLLLLCLGEFVSEYSVLLE